MFNKMMALGFWGFLALLTVSLAYGETSANQPVQCFVTVNKAPQWLHENIIINVMDYSTKQIIQTLHLPAATSDKASVNTDTESFDCIHHTMIQLEASYTPSVWSTDIGRNFVSRNTYNLYGQLFDAKKDNTKKLIITVKFPEDFIGVPNLVN